MDNAFQPKFHKEASNLEDVVPFKECIELHSSEKAAVRAPRYLLLTYNGHIFNIVVNPTYLSVMFYITLHSLEAWPSFQWKY